jgi:uncharacterized membrane protein (DUF373 family)
MESAMIEWIKKFERAIILALVVMMALVLLFATVELGWIIAKDILSPPLFILEIDELLEIFGLFMLVLIGVELLETIVKSYLRQSCDHARIVIAVAIIAIARKVIIIDVKDSSGPVLFGLAGLLFALCVGYFLVKSRGWGRSQDRDSECCDD